MAAAASAAVGTVWRKRQRPISCGEQRPLRAKMRHSGVAGAQLWLLLQLLLQLLLLLLLPLRHVLHLVGVVTR